MLSVNAPAAAYELIKTFDNPQIRTRKEYGARPPIHSLEGEGQVVEMPGATWGKYKVARKKGKEPTNAAGPDGPGSISAPAPGRGSMTSSADLLFVLLQKRSAAEAITAKT